MENKIATCVIISAAPVENVEFIKNCIEPGSFVICADGGIDYAIACGITPDLLIGDFDSMKTILPENLEHIKLPVMKDDTDTMAAVKIGLQKGYRRFVFLCASDGRLDHTYANLCTMQYILSQGGEACMVDEKKTIYLVHDKSLAIEQAKGKTISVFPFACHYCTVTYKGLLYPLEHAKLYSDGFPMGVSNEIIQDYAEIQVHEGDALIILNHII